MKNQHLGTLPVSHQLRQPNLNLLAAFWLPIILLLSANVAAPCLHAQTGIKERPSAALLDLTTDQIVRTQAWLRQFATPDPISQQQRLSVSQFPGWEDDRYDLLIDFALVNGTPPLPEVGDRLPLQESPFTETQQRRVRFLKATRRLLDGTSHFGVPDMDRQHDRFHTMIEISLRCLETGTPAPPEFVVQLVDDFRSQPLLVPHYCTLDRLEACHEIAYGTPFPTERFPYRPELLDRMVNWKSGKQLYHSAPHRSAVDFTLLGMSEAQVSHRYKKIQQELMGEDAAPPGSNAYWLNLQVLESLALRLPPNEAFEELKDFVLQPEVASRQKPFIESCLDELSMRLSQQQWDWYFQTVLETGTCHSQVVRNYLVDIPVDEFHRRRRQLTETLIPEGIKRGDPYWGWLVGPDLFRVEEIRDVQQRLLETAEGLSDEKRAAIGQLLLMRTGSFPVDEQRMWVQHAYAMLSKPSDSWRQVHGVYALVTHGHLKFLSDQ